MQGTTAAQWTGENFLPHRLFDDFPDRPGAAAALGAAAEAAIHLPRRARRRRRHRRADVIIAEDIAGADDHQVPVRAAIIARSLTGAFG